VGRHVAAREARPPRPDAGAAALRIDPSVCDGVGICAHLAPDLISVDSWGYPILRAGTLDSASERRQAAAAAAACPRRALRVTG
jgi:ferredoxin